jgi:glycosyltransferase involved in cell wall biosynthesis
MKISACWIVKKGEAALAASIESVKGCADEIIVVDTGSDDKTTLVAVFYKGQR